MKGESFMVIVVAFLFVLPAVYSGELDKPYSPTRKEWLDISFLNLLKIELMHGVHR